MKKIIIEALKNNQKVRFYFDKENSFTATTLVDEMPNDEKLIYVGQTNYDQNSVVNLEIATRVRIFK